MCLNAINISSNVVERRADVRSERIQCRVHVLKMGSFSRDVLQYSEVCKLFQIYQILLV